MPTEKEKMLAGELYRDGILVNAVCPGWMPNDGSRPGGRFFGGHPDVRRCGRRGLMIATGRERGRRVTKHFDDAITIEKLPNNSPAANSLLAGGTFSSPWLNT